MKTRSPKLVFVGDNSRTVAVYYRSRSGRYQCRALMYYNKGENAYPSISREIARIQQQLYTYKSLQQMGCVVFPSIKDYVRKRRVLHAL